MAVYHIIRSRKKTRVYSLLQPKITADVRHNLHKISPSGKVYIHYHSGLFLKELFVAKFRIRRMLMWRQLELLIQHNAILCGFILLFMIVEHLTGLNEDITRWLDVNGHTHRLTRKLTFRRRNFLLKFSTPCIYNVNNTGTKKGSIMK